MAINELNDSESNEVIGENKTGRVLWFSEKEGRGISVAEILRANEYEFDSVTYEIV